MNDAGNLARDSEPARAFARIDDLDCRGRRVFLRVDPYVLGELSDSLPPEPRAEPAPTANPAPVDGAAPASQPAPAEGPSGPTYKPSSLRRLLELDARVVLATHLSSEAARDTGISSVEELASRLSEQLGVDVLMPDECVGDAVTRVIQDLRKGQLCLLPDLGAERGELRNEEAFARALAQQVDAYVGDALSAAHEAYASLVKLPRLFTQRALGEGARRELEGLARLLSAPRGALTGWVGGNSFTEKAELLEEWLPRFATLCVGGRAALTLLAALGRAELTPGVEADSLARARSFATRARDLGVELRLPVDFLVREPPEPSPRLVAPRAIPPAGQVLDIGPETRALFLKALERAPQLLWWAPLGDVELRDGTAASRALAEACASAQVHATLLGADLRRFVRQLPAEVHGRIELVLAAPAAAKLLLSKRKLPGLEALRVRH